MFLTTAFELLAAIQIGDKALSLVQNIPMISLLFGNSKTLNSSHNKFYQAFAIHLKNIYGLDDDAKLPVFVRPEGEIRSQSITINTWFSPEMLDENLMLANQGKFGQKILLIEANIINRQLLKTYDLIYDKSSFANVLIGYLYYFVNYELVLMNGHEKELEHINGILKVLDSIIADSKISEKALSESNGRLHENLQSIINTIKHNVKPKIHKQIARKTVKEKLDNTAQNFHLVSYAILNSLILITEGNVNFHLSLDPNLIKDGFLQTGSQYSWFSKDQAHSITTKNPLKNLFMQGYNAIHNISQDKRQYGKLDVVLPGIADIKKYLNDYYAQIDETFLYYSLLQNGADSREVVYIYKNEEVLNERAKFIYSLASFAIKLINTSYVIENLLDLLAVNNDSWVFNDNETQSLDGYFNSIENEMKLKISNLHDFANNYNRVKAVRGKTLTSSIELVKYVNVIIECLNGKTNPSQDIKLLSLTDKTKKHQLNHIKRETLYILDEYADRSKETCSNTALVTDNYIQELGEIMYWCRYIGSDEREIKIIKQNFDVTSIHQLRNSYGSESPFCELNSFYKLAATTVLKEHPNYKDIIIGTLKKKHDNFHVNLIANLAEAITNLRDNQKTHNALYRTYNMYLKYLKHLKDRFLGLILTKDVVGEYAAYFDDDIDEIYYQDVLALKEHKADGRVTLLEKALDESSKENTKLNQIIKEHLLELRNVNEKHNVLQDKIQELTNSLEKSKKEVSEYEKTQSVLEQHIDRLLDTQIHNIEDCHSEVLTLDALSESLRKMMSYQNAQEDTNILFSIYDVISKFKERMKIKCETLSLNARSIVESFDELKMSHKLITNNLKKRTEQVLASYKDISIKIAEIVKKLEMQSELLSSVTANIEKAKQQKALKKAREKEEVEIRKFEKAKRRVEEREKVSLSNKQEGLKNKNEEVVAENAQEITDVFDDNKNPRKTLDNNPSSNSTLNKYNSNMPSNSIQIGICNHLYSYSLYATNHWFFYFREEYKTNKCAKLFQAILNNEELLFEHRLVILNRIIEKITRDEALQYFNAGNFHNVVENIKASSKEIISNANKESITNNSELEMEVFKYTEDLENEVNSNIFYDLCFSSRKYM